LHPKVHMILIRPNLQKLNLIPLLYVHTHRLQNIIHLFIKHCTPIFGREYQRVYQYRYVMTLMYVLAHTPILRRKRRGIGPQGIQALGESCLDQCAHLGRSGLPRCAADQVPHLLMAAGELFGCGQQRLFAGGDKRRRAVRQAS
jgi:hypothetical protein